MPYFNLHTHSRFCDGSEEPEEYVKAALKAGFHSLGFSSHAPVPFKNNFAIRDDHELQEYCGNIRDLRLKYQDQISIWLALEMDYIEGVSKDFQVLKDACRLDYTIGSVHLVRNGDDKSLWFIDGPKVDSYNEGLENIFGGDIRRAVTTYYEQVSRMILTQKPDMIGHFDKIKMHNQNRYFREDEAWYRKLVMDLLDTIESSGSIIEINTRGIYKKRCDDLYPGQWLLKEIRKKGLPVTLSSDAHRPEEIDGYFTETLEILRDIGFKYLVYFEEDGWKEQAI